MSSQTQMNEISNEYATFEEIRPRHGTNRQSNQHLLVPVLFQTHPFLLSCSLRGRFVHPTSASIMEFNWIKNPVSYLSKEFWKSVTSFHMNSVLAWHETSILDLVWLLFKQCSMFIIYLNVLYKLNEYCISVLCNVVTFKISCSQLRLQHYLGECWGGFMLGLSKVARRMSVYCLKCLVLFIPTPCSDGVYQF